jgi:hypothetical protein
VHSLSRPEVGRRRLRGTGVEFLDYGRGRLRDERFFLRRGHGEKATAQVWEGAEGLEFTLPSPPPYHTFTTPLAVGLKDGS